MSHPEKVADKAEYEDAKGAFLKVLDTTNMLIKYKAPLEERQNQILDAGAAAVCHQFISVYHCSMCRLYQARLVPFQLYLLGAGQEAVREGTFFIRGTYHTLFNPEGTASYIYPAGYEAVRKCTRLIQEARGPKAAPATPAPAALAKNKVRGAFLLPVPASYNIPSGLPAPQRRLRLSCLMTPMKKRRPLVILSPLKPLLIRYLFPLSSAR